MIQRIQSIYLLVAATTSAAMLFLVLASNLTSVPETAYIYTGFGVVNSDDVPVKELVIGEITGYLLIGLCIMTLITIFMYKNRHRQVLASKFLLLLTSGALYTMVQTVSDVKEQFSQDLDLNWPFYLPGLILLLIILAIRSIQKDDDLVRASERLR